MRLHANIIDDEETVIEILKLLIEKCIPHALKHSYVYLFFLTVVTFNAVRAQDKQGLVAKYSFNNGKDYNEINKRKAKFVGVERTEDRFGNANNAVILFGDSTSYIDLGNYPELKQRSATISMWINMGNKTFSGKGITANPIILTRSRLEEDFSEAYGIYYNYDKGIIGSCGARDSLRQVSCPSLNPFILNEWHHMVMTYDDSFLTFYLDGKLQRKAVKNYETRFLESAPVLVGSTGKSRKNQRFLDAVVDDIQFYNRVLSDGEIMALYHTPNPNKYAIIFKWIYGCLALLAGVTIIYFLVRYRLNLSAKKEKESLQLANTLLENELRINRALMNPHFMFNSLNTLHSYILTHNIDKASDYLTRFSKLVRKVLDSNMSDTISLEMEIELIKGYLEIEGLRFKEHIQYTITVDPGIAPSSTIIPIMMIQPFIENSVWHGLREKPGKKTIHISFSLLESKYVECIIEDNGTGRKKREPDTTSKKSLATGFVEHRLLILNQIHDLNCSLTIIDKPDCQGTIVKIILPILKK